MSLLEVRGLSKRYGEVQALGEVDLDLAAGGRMAVVGPSGSGKSTLLRLLAGFEAPDAGMIRLAGATLADGGRAVPAHRRGIGVVAQDGALFPHLSIADNIGFGLAAKGPARGARIGALMDMVELPRAMAARRPHEISGGQQQRVALARALAREPKLMLLDEPFSALDTGLREAMRKAVAGVLAAAGVTTILVTHDQGEALSFADRVAVLREGRLVQAGTPQALYRRPVDPQTAAFLGDAIILEARIERGEARCRLGVIPVETAGGEGTAEILLRPEQLHLSAGGVGAAGGGIEGEVEDVEFAGAAATVVVRLADGLPPLAVRCSGLDLPTPGSRVVLTVLGTAHVFPPRR